jgi:alanine dehydrogenase
MTDSPFNAGVLQYVPIFDGSATEALLPLPELIEAVGRAFDRHAADAHRVVLSEQGHDWVVMPGLTGDGGLICKLLRVGGASTEGSPTITGIFALLAPDGSVEALLDGATLTARRTAAAAAYATSLLARPDASVLTVFGAGGLAAQHVEAISTVRPLREVRVVGRSPARTRVFQEHMATRGFDVTISTAEEGLRGADIVAAVTTSTSPVFADADVEPGTHINAMGSYKPERAEIPAETVARARVVVETRASAWTEAGDLIQPRDAGLIDESHVLAEFHERERIAAIRREAPDAVTLFKSVGHVALDLAALEVARAPLAAAAR